MIKYFCNRCEKEIVGDVVKINPIWQTKGKENGEHVYENTAERDYCRNCSDEIHAFMMCTAVVDKTDKGTNSDKETKPDSDTDRKKRGRPKTSQPEQKNEEGIDEGKILALKDAGWTNKNIAADMKLDESIVNQVILKRIRKNIAKITV